MIRLYCPECRNWSLERFQPCPFCGCAKQVAYDLPVWRTRSGLEMAYFEMDDTHLDRVRKLTAKALSESMLYQQIKRAERMSVVLRGLDAEIERRRNNVPADEFYPRAAVMPSEANQKFINALIGWMRNSNQKGL